MNRLPVSSSNILSVGYEVDSKVLEVEFKNGSVYQYYDVAEDVYVKMLDAESIGVFLNQSVKPSYEYKKVS